jgi:L-cysteine:1D-myo-inositol 2-amino-2-deoxy-alpha-D-glucopyranoside ligase
VKSWPRLYIPQLPERFQVPPLSLFDSASLSVKQIPQQQIYRMYVCGITPYDATHLGHAATYLSFDLIYRYLLATGSDVQFVQNITDIDDPLLERALRDGVDWKTLAQSQIELFRSDMSALHIVPPAHYIGVVEAMPLVIEAISRLKQAETTYLVDEDLYFRVTSDPEYGTRSHLTFEEATSLFAERGGDPDRVGKENPFDALVWLTSRPDQPSWESPFGNGRPGWHIECSAIALHYLAHAHHESEFSIDIQGGGSDLSFPHHEMSAAQSRAISGKPFARHYVHAGMIGLNGVKMSKSLGNLVFVSRLIAEGFDPMAIRWALLDRHYRKDFMWSSEVLHQASREIDELRTNLSKLDVAPTEKVISEVINALATDLDSPKALAALRSWCIATQNGETGGNAGELSRAIDSLLGIAL